MRRIFLALTLLMLISAPALGLSDAEYRRFKRISSEFRNADKELAEVWNGLKKSLSSKAFAELQKDQREWIRKGRDDAAKKYIKEGYSRAEAYTMATNDRTEALSGIAENIKGKLDPSKRPEPRKPVKPAPSPDTDDEDDDKGEIEEERFKDSEPGNPEGNYSSKNGLMTVLITDKENMEASVTISINTPVEATWSAENWIDGDTLVLYDKTYSDCHVTLTFMGNKVKVEASETESWNDVLGEGITLSGTYTRN